MIIVTKEQFFNFIKAQPDDRELRFSESSTNQPCGCPMIHYAKEFFDESYLCALTFSWVKDQRIPYAEFERGINLYSFLCNAINYKQFKKHLSEKYPDFNWS